MHAYCYVLKDMASALPLPILVCLVLASRSGGRQRSPLYYNFSTNAAPINGSCSIDPELGYADPIVTQFNVTCPDYVDSDQPLEYLLFFNGSGLFFSRDFF